MHTKILLQKKKKWNKSKSTTAKEISSKNKEKFVQMQTIKPKKLQFSSKTVSSYQANVLFSGLNSNSHLSIIILNLNLT